MMLNTSPRLILTLFISTRCVRFVGRRRDTVESALVFVLVSRRASNSSNQETNHNMLPDVAMAMKKYQLAVLVNVYYRCVVKHE